MNHHENIKQSEPLQAVQNAPFTTPIASSRANQYATPEKFIYLSINGSTRKFEKVA